MKIKPLSANILAIICCSAVLVSCASNRRGPIVDMKGVDRDEYYADLQECESYADEVQVAERAAGGAVTGAVVLGTLGAILGNSNTAERMGGAGAVTGGVSGAADGMAERRVVVRNCLRGRGYRVLN